MSDGVSGDNIRTGSAGDRLRAAREAQGLSLADVAARTRVTQRYLEAIELGRPEDLPSSTYAVGFAKAYARAVGEDQVAIGRDVRDELRMGGAPRQMHHFEEIADPARGPSRGVVIVAMGLAIAVAVIAAILFSTGMFTAAKDQPASAPSVSAEVPAPAASTPAPAAAPTGGAVVLTANDEVWLRVYDGAGTRLFQGTMKPGDRFEVPANAVDPMVNVGRPDKLALTVGGRAVPPLGDGKRALMDVKIGAPALLARIAAAGATPSPVTSASGATTAPTPAPSDSATARAGQAPQ